MRTTDRPTPRFDLLHPAWILAFFAIAFAWVVIAGGGDWQSTSARAAARLAGYVGFVAMLIPYLHILRRSARSSRGRPLAAWLRWHIGSAYLAFAMVLVHSRGRAGSPLTTVLLWLTWITMVSGVIGYYGQKLLYAWMPRLVPREFGLERLPGECRRTHADAQELCAKKEMVSAAGVVAEFGQNAVQWLDRPLRFSLADWFRPATTGQPLLSENGVERTRSYADDKQRDVLDELWRLVEARRQMDLEYRLHQLGRLWLYVHGPAAWALLIVMVEHVVMSWWYGGF